VLLAALAINFAVPRLMPGNPVDRFAAGVKLTAEARGALIERFGLDASLWEQFQRYLVNALKGDFGLSFSYFPRPVWDLIMEALPWTLLVLTASIVIQVVVGYLLGVISAWKAGTRTDTILQTISLAIFSAPLFWVAMVLLYIFSFQLDWFPLSGAYTVGAEYSGVLEWVGDILRHAALPILALSVAQYASYQLILRNNMVGVLKEPYILLAEAKGLSDRRIKHRHAARNALLPVITFLGLSFAMSISGSVFVESVFSYPGVGKLIHESVLSRDYPVLQGCFLIFSIVVIVANFLVDIAYWFLDPRIRY
jgi:peptide/nickel transport system permease protein